MTHGFQSRVAFVATSNGRNCKLCKPIVFIARDGAIYVMPEGASTDGASIPRALWDVLPPFGDYWLAAFLHDCAYQNTLQMETQDTPSPMLVTANLSKDKCDDLLKEAMESLGVDEADIQTIYNGVKFGGWLAFKEDRNVVG